MRGNGPAVVYLDTVSEYGEENLDLYAVNRSIRARCPGAKKGPPRFCDVGFVL
jgi:hypothetical protein